MGVIMPQFLLIGVLLSVAGVILANWQKVLMVVIIVLLIGFGILVLVNGLSVEAAFDSLISSLKVVWLSLVELTKSIFSESQTAVEEVKQT